MRIIRDVKQGTTEWLRLRLGVVTASDADRIVTAKTLKPSAAQRNYVSELVAETLIGAPLDFTTDKWRERGIQLEAEARDWYCLMRETVEEVGFIQRDDRLVGCSPDAIIEGRRGVEIKCPAAATHIGYLLAPETLVADYRLQVQFSLWLTRWPVWDLLSYCPTLPTVVREVRPEPEVFAALDAEVPKVLAAREAALRRIADMRDDPELPEDEDARAAAIIFGE
jgi:hypothetical protein